MEGSPFRRLRHTNADKWITIVGPGDLLLQVDYDDVDRTQVLRDAQHVVGVLNRFWDERSSEDCGPV